MHRLAARTGFEVRRRYAHRRPQRSTISDDGQAAVIADIGPLVRVSGPRISLVEPTRQVFVHRRNPGPQTERAIHMHPRALFFSRFTDFPSAIEHSRLPIPSFNPPT